LEDLEKYAVYNTFTRKEFALKEMSKIKVISKKSANSVMNERKILANLRNEFIVNMHAAIQNDQYL